MREFSWYSILRQLGKILHGVWRWHSLRRQYHLDYAAALLVLPESDDTWNRTALEYYPDYLARKCVTRGMKEPACMYSITPEMVMEAVQNYFQKIGEA